MKLSAYNLIFRPLWLSLILLGGVFENIGYAEENSGLAKIESDSSKSGNLEISDKAIKQDKSSHSNMGLLPLTENIGEFASSLLFAKRDVHIWHRYIRDFRRDHHFAFTMGGSKGKWRANRFGTLYGRSFESTGVFGKIQYSFHIPIYKGFGYFLGSSFGYHYEIPDRTADMIPDSGIHYPSLLVGGAYNFSPGFRVSVGIDYFLERFEKFSERDGVSGQEDGLPDDPQIGVTMSSLDFSIAFDYFLNLNFGLRLDYHNRSTEYERPVKVTGKPINAELAKDDQWVGLGVVYHLL